MPRQCILTAAERSALLAFPTEKSELTRVYRLPSEREGCREEIIRTMCAAPDSVLRFLPERLGALHPARILSEVTAHVLYVGEAKPRFNLRPLLAHLRMACRESRERFLTNSFLAQTLVSW